MSHNFHHQLSYICSTDEKDKHHIIYYAISCQHFGSSCQ